MRCTPLIALLVLGCRNVLDPTKLDELPIEGTDIEDVDASNTDAPSDVPTDVVTTDTPTDVPTDDGSTDPSDPGTDPVDPTDGSDALTDGSDSPTDGSDASTDGPVVDSATAPSSDDTDPGVSTDPTSDDPGPTDLAPTDAVDSGAPGTDGGTDLITDSPSDAPTDPPADTGADADRDDDGFPTPADCDDNNAGVNPGQVEIPYDGVDQDCDPSTPDDDLDGDGAPFPADCDDADGSVWPGAPEACDGRDNDCDGDIDESGGSLWYVDGDGDGFGEPGVGVVDCDGLGLVADASDCDDADGGVFPGAPERCDGVDQDCDGAADEGAADATLWYADVDADGFGDPAALVLACAQPPGSTPDASDCDDTRQDISPAGVEVCNGLDDDCSGTIDDGASDVRSWWADGDGDGWGAGDAQSGCLPPEDAVFNDADCDDAAAGVYPGAPESCDGSDQDCDGVIDEDPQDPRTYWVDLDGDGRGDPAASVSACAAGPGQVANDDDCDDRTPTTWEGAPEVCDGADNDCDGTVDEGAGRDATWYADTDGDGFGDPGTAEVTCQVRDGWVLNALDCDDARAAIRPGAAETCDGVDQNCNGRVDEQPTDGQTWYVDVDRDGYGSTLFTVSACAAPAGFVATATDCDDGRPESYPGADEVCDGADNDCDGALDEDATDRIVWYRDADQDGVGTPLDAVLACTRPVGYSFFGQDCDDSNRNVRPSASETCDAIDRNCDGDAYADAVDTRPFYGDADGDGFGDPTVTVEACLPSAGLSARPDDCDDDVAAINPGAEEVCNGVDDNCNTLIDDNASDRLLAYRDGDGDGFGNPAAALQTCFLEPGLVDVAEDCDDRDPAIFPGADEVCDGLDNDCDAQRDEDALDADTWYLDADRDGYGTADIVVEACFPPANHVRNARDCDDQDAGRSPAAAEICDGLDQDCDGAADDGLASATWYLDVDEDGWGRDDGAVQACAAPPGHVAAGGDCDDTDYAISPSASELCNDLDDDCDGEVDAGAEDAGVWHADRDEDGFGDPDVSIAACEAPLGFVDDDADCDDDQPAAFPGAAEQCNGRDDDCNGLADDGIPLPRWYADADRDGFGATGVSVASCAPPAGYVPSGGDCNDAVATINPARSEVCNGLDDNCDAVVDTDAVDRLTFYADGDGDTYGSPAVVVRACALPAGASTNALDCNDAAASTRPGATETCNGVDDNCDSYPDFPVPAGAPMWYLDADRDGHAGSLTQRACAQPEGYLATSTDCNDGDALSFPGATEVCDSRDNDCDAQIDEGNVGIRTWYADADRDNFGNPAVSVQACAQPAGYTTNALDCADNAAARYPGAPELCNTIDDDCDGVTDEDATNATTFYADIDRDGYGTNAATTRACTRPSGYVTNATDCDDTRAQVSPAGTEVCDNLDNNCNTVVDDNATDARTWYRDADNDTYGRSSDTRRQCPQPAGYVASSTDCDDNRGNVNPGAPEVCADTLDNDCDGAVNEDAAVDALPWYRDADADAYGNAAQSRYACTQPSGYVSNNQDCNDTTNAVRPGAAETCNARDDDCDNKYDDGGVCPCDTYWLFGARDSYMFCTTARPWTGARDFCRTYGYNLITVNDADESLWADARADSYSDEKWWIGLNDIATEGSFVWQSGQPVTFTNWHAGEPNNVGAGGEDCTQFNRWGDATWNDEPCTSAFRFICESD